MRLPWTLMTAWNPGISSVCFGLDRWRFEASKIGTQKKKTVIPFWGKLDFHSLKLRFSIFIKNSDLNSWKSPFTGERRSETRMAFLVIGPKFQKCANHWYISVVWNGYGTGRHALASLARWAARSAAASGVDLLCERSMDMEIYSGGTSNMEIYGNWKLLEIAWKIWTCH